MDSPRAAPAADRELHRLEEALRLSEQRFRAVMEQSPLSTQVLTPEGETVAVNAAWEALWGATLADLAGYNILQDPQLEEQGIAPLLRRAFAGEAVRMPVVPYDPTRVRPELYGDEDTTRWVSAFAYPVKDRDGAVREVVLVHQDVTDERRAQERLRSNQEATRLLADAGEALGSSIDYRTTLRNLAGLLVPRLADWCAVDLLDEAGQLERVSVIHADPSREALAGDLLARYPAQRGHPHGSWAVLDSGQPQFVEQVDEEFLAHAAQDQGHLALLHGLGVRSFLRVPLSTRGRAIGVLTLVHAGSGRRYTRADLELAMELANRAAAAVDNARLFSQLQAEDRRKDEFLATLSHELRNPLAPIRSGLAVLKSGPPPDTANRMLAIMDRQLGHLVRLVDDLLDLSRISCGTIVLRRATLPVGELVNSAVEASRPVLDAAGVLLRTRLPQAPLVVEGDHTRLAQVLTNLLNNAARFTPAGGEVTLTAEAGAGYVLLEVADTGAGIEPGMLGSIFDLFVRGDDAGQQAPGGLGLGLTLVRQLVELHGGSVWAHSDGPGRGSRFTVRLPSSAAPEGGAERERAS